MHTLTLNIYCSKSTKKTHTTTVWKKCSGSAASSRLAPSSDTNRWFCIHIFDHITHIFVGRRRRRFAQRQSIDIISRIFSPFPSSESMDSHICVFKCMACTFARSHTHTPDALAMHSHSFSLSIDCEWVVVVPPEICIRLRNRRANTAISFSW